MRGVTAPRLRIPTAARSLLWAALLSGALAPAVQAQTPNSGNADAEQIALAYPRVSLHGNADVAMPQPLSPSDAALGRRIFALQDKGKLQQADALIGELQSPLLLGAIYADRYLGRFHHSTADELRAWLSQFADEPEAPEIYALLLKRLPRGETPPPEPPSVKLAQPAAATDQAPDPDPQPGITRRPALDHAVAEHLQRDQAHAALHLIATTKGLDPAYADLLRAEVARALFVANDDSEAVQVAAAAARQGPDDRRVGQAAYIAGLAAWRLGHVEQARSFFEAGAQAPIASETVRAAASFWAARANAKLHDRGAALNWMRQAAESRSTLHGLIARRILGLSTGIIPSGDLVSQADVDAVAATSAGKRAFALLEVNEPQRAAAELRQLWAALKDDGVMRQALLMVAAGTGLRELAGEFAMRQAAADGDTPAAPPTPTLQPEHGFEVDPALVYALTRTESNFNPDAVSSAGARGLMQLMPVTAKFIAGGDKDVSGEMLHNPGLNLALGQRYVAWLAQQQSIDGNLLVLLASYNQGPGGVAKWLPSMRDAGDPLLFLEAIPVDETRAFVRDVLTWSWLYAAQLHVPAPSLDALAAGEFPRFTPLHHGSKLASAQHG